MEMLIIHRIDICRKNFNYSTDFSGKFSPRFSAIFHNVPQFCSIFLNFSQFKIFFCRVELCIRASPPLSRATSKNYNNFWGGWALTPANILCVTFLMNKKSYWMITKHWKQWKQGQITKGLRRQKSSQCVGSWWSVYWSFCKSGAFFFNWGWCEKVD